jgi:hypothetical protein
MNDNERFLWARMRGWTLPALIARLIEAFECNEQRASEIIRFKYLLGRHSRSKNQIIEEVAQTIDTSDAASTKYIFGKTLHERSKYLPSYFQLLDSWYDDNTPNVEELNYDLVHSEEWYERSKQENDDFQRRDLLDNPRFVSILEEDSKRYDEDPALKHAFAAEWGLDPNVPSFDLVLRAFAKQRNQARDGYFANKSSMSSTVFWAKEMVGRLPGVIEREDVLESHPFAAFGKQIPLAHRTLFEQAHMLYLFDFDIPCVLTCGALVEELVGKEFPDLSSKWSVRSEQPTNWKSKVGDIVSQYPRYRSAKPMLENIMDNRNVAAHDPSAYLSSGRERSEGILRMTRQVLEIFFEAANSQVEGK